jgi:hypothetical protein
VAIARRVEPRKWHIKVWVLSTSLWSLKWLQRVAWSMSSVFVTSEFEVATARRVEHEFCLCHFGVWSGYSAWRGAWVLSLSLRSLCHFGVWSDYSAPCGILMHISRTVISVHGLIQLKYFSSHENGFMPSSRSSSMSEFWWTQR